MADDLPDAPWVTQNAELPDAPWATHAASVVGASAPVAPGVGSDALQSFAGGVERSALGLAGLPGDVRNLGSNAVQGAASYLGANPEMAARIGHGASTAIKFAVPALSGPPTSDLIKLYENAAGPIYEAQTTPGKYAQTMGEFLPAVIGGPESMATKLATRVVAPAVASEAAGEATQGTAAEPYARIAGALASPLGVGALRRAITPLPSSDIRQQAVAALQGQGVNSLTAGQITGSKPLQWFEQALGDIPLSGKGAAKSAEQAAEQFTAAALKKTGTIANRATPDVIDGAFTRIGSEFDRLSASHDAIIRPSTWNDLQSIQNEYHSLVPPSMRAPIVENVVSDIGNIASNNRGLLNGESYQALRSQLDRAARGSRANPQLSGALFDIRNTLDKAMEQSIAASGNSADIQAWKTARRQYKNMLVIEKAATSAGENAAMGLISPPQLRAATIAQGRRAYARGTGDFAELARSGEAIMRPLPQSGTAPRSYAQHLPAAGLATLGGIFGGVPGAASAGLAAIAGPPLMGRALMSRPVQSYLGNQLMAHAAPQWPNWYRALANASLASAPMRIAAPIDNGGQ